MAAVQQTNYVAVVSVPSNPSPGNPGVIFHNSGDNSPYYDDGTTVQKIPRMSEVSTPNVFIQQTEPVAASPFIWYKTNALGDVIDILKG